MYRQTIGVKVGSSSLSRTPDEHEQAAQQGEVFELVCRHLRKLVGPAAPDYDDLVQAAAERALRDLPRFEGRCSLSTWVFRVSYSTLIDQRRAYRRWLRRLSGATQVDPNDLDSGRPAVDDAIHWAERNRRLRETLERIGVKRSTVVNLHDLQGVDITEIAELLDINILTARSRLRDGRRELARRLKNDPYFGDSTPEPEAHS